MTPPSDHPLRYAITNELHARPVLPIEAPCRMVYLALHQADGAVRGARANDLKHLRALLARHGADQPDEAATHYAGPLGRDQLKWESHNEFVTYSAVLPGVDTRPFNPEAAEVFPSDWLAEAPGQRLVSALIRVEILTEEPEALSARFKQWFVAESLACAWVLDGAAVVASDFRIDPAGHMRFAVFLGPGTSQRRAGRIVQRLCEIETYKTMSLLALGPARALMARLNHLEAALVDLVDGLASETGRTEERLHELLSLAAELEGLAMQNSYRFAATNAYEAIVGERVAVLRESRFEGRQTFSEFMRRRYDPAIRTIKAAEHRLEQLARRAARASELLRTRVDVERSAQNQTLLASMNRRADLQLRLQHTVEGLSVVAISYYAVNLASYVLTPFGERLGLDHFAVSAGLTPVIVVIMWLALRQIRKRMR